MSKKLDSHESSKAKEHARQRKFNRAKRKVKSESQRQHYRKAQKRNAKEIRSAIDWVLGDEQAVPTQAHGNTGWKTMTLMIQALLWIFSDKDKLKDAFDSGTRQCKKVHGRIAFSSYSGLIKALVRWTPWLSEVLLTRIQKQIETTAGKLWRTTGWVVMAVDGSRDTTPRTLSNEKAFCAPNHGHGKTARYRKKKTKGMRRQAIEKNPPAPPVPQIWITMIWHVATQLTWCWKLGPSNASERAHVQEMLENGEFPEKTLFTGDAGFVGYEFWKSIIDGGHHFLVRVGANVNLLHSLGYDVEPDEDNLVYCWPKDKRREGMRPLKLRMIQIQLGRKKAVLLTSVLDEKKLTDKQALVIYKSRWGIELEFRNLKQTYGRRQLRCRQSIRALVELHWSILSILIVKLYALKVHLAKKRRRGDPVAMPGRISFAGVVRSFQRILENLNETDLEEPSLSEMLGDALIDNYERKSSKEARYKPNKKDKPRCGLPNVTRATKEDRDRLQKLGFCTVA